MAEWLAEAGIGETRMVRVEADGIVEARILLDGLTPAGSILDARLSKSGGQTLAVAAGQEFLLPKGAPGVCDGAALRIEVTREAIPGVEPWKRPLARVTDQAPRDPSLDSLPLPFPVPEDRLAHAGWADLIEQARGGVVPFEGGELRLFATPAMTLIDVDGHLPPSDLALAAAVAAARTIPRLGIGGSIGIDFPTVGGRAERQRIGDLLDAQLPRPFERTAVNGFGFVQIVRPRRHASLLELAADRAAFECRALLRRAALERRGGARLVVHPAMAAMFERRGDWCDALARQIGGSVRVRSDPALRLPGGYCEPI